MHVDEGKALGLSISYELLDFDLMQGGSERLAALLDDAEQRGFSGLNITYPSKQAVIPLLHELAPEARALHSVNTVLFRNGKRIGHNTDWWGFAESFRRDMSDVNTERRGPRRRRRRRRGGGLRHAEARLAITDDP